MDLVQYVSERIRELRTGYGGGLSQEALAKKLNIAANTVSRWETGTYKPGLEDLDKLSRFFGVSILEFFPKEEVDADSKVTALLRAARDLPKEDIDELSKYAEYRRARALLSRGSSKKKSGKSRTQDD
jgi:transcriptional regulator with XRE-family HTH domain